MAKNFTVSYKQIQQALDVVPANQFPNIAKIKDAFSLDGFNISKPRKGSEGVYSATFWRSGEDEQKINIVLSLLFISSRELDSDTPINFNKQIRVRLANDDMQNLPLTKKICEELGYVDYKESGFAQKALINGKNAIGIKDLEKPNYFGVIAIKCPTESFHIDHGCKRIGVLSLNGHGTMVLNDKDSKEALEECGTKFDAPKEENLKYKNSKHDYFAHFINDSIRSDLEHDDLFKRAIEVKKGGLSIWNGIQMPNPRVHASPKCSFEPTPSEANNVLPSFISFLKDNPNITAKNTVLLNLSMLDPKQVSTIESSRKLVAVLHTKGNIPANS